MPRRASSTAVSAKGDDRRVFHQKKRIFRPPPYLLVPRQLDVQRLSVRHSAEIDNGNHSSPDGLLRSPAWPIRSCFRNHAVPSPDWRSKAARSGRGIMAVMPKTATCGKRRVSLLMVSGACASRMSRQPLHPACSSLRDALILWATDSVAMPSPMRRALKAWETARRTCAMSGSIASCSVAALAG